MTGEVSVYAEELVGVQVWVVLMAGTKSLGRYRATPVAGEHQGEPAVVVPGGAFPALGGDVTADRFRLVDPDRKQFGPFPLPSKVTAGKGDEVVFPAFPLTGPAVQAAEDVGYVEQPEGAYPDDEDE